MCFSFFCLFYLFFSCLLCFSFILFFSFSLVFLVFRRILFFSTFSSIFHFYMFLVFFFHFSSFFQCVTVSFLMFLFSLNFSCSSYESFSCFLVFLSRAGGFGPSFSAWMLALPPWERVGNFRSGGCPFLFQFGVGPSCRAGPPFPGWVGLLSRVKVDPSFSGEGWPFGSGLARPQGGKPAKKGEKGKARGPTKRKGRGGARPDPRAKEASSWGWKSSLGRMGRLMIIIII